MSFYTSNILGRLDREKLKTLKLRLMAKKELTGSLKFGWLADRVDVEINRRIIRGIK